MEGLERWRGKVALVTGASSGIGEAIAQALAQAGLKVAAVARRRERLDRLVEEVRGAGGDMIAVTADLAREADILAMFSAVHDHWGTVDVLVNNAGSGRMGPLEAGSADDLRQMLEVNVLAVSISMREALKDMEGKEDAIIINISTIYAHLPQVPNFSFYQGSKMALRAMTDTLRAELHARNSKVRVGMISPGMTATEFRTVASGGRISYESYFEGCQPLLPADLAQAALYMLSTPSYVQVHDILLSPIGLGL
jgi:NADP-dependent 3-hydroxy acid dehydrogenase YdfG